MQHRTLRCMIITVVLCLCMGFPDARAEISIELTDTDWTWEPSNIAAFEGTVSFDEMPYEKLLLELTFSTTPEATDPGGVVFQTVNQKKLTLRKQKPEYVFTPENTAAFTFTGNWKTPDEVYFSRVEIVFRIYDETGTTLLAEKSLIVSREASDIADNDDGKFRITTDFSAWTLWTGVAALSVWLAAIVRIIIYKKRKRR